MYTKLLGQTTSVYIAPTKSMVTHLTITNVYKLPSYRDVRVEVKSILYFFLFNIDICIILNTGTNP